MYNERSLSALACKLLGHTPSGPVIPCGSGEGKWRDELGNVIAYRFRHCRRCHKQIPASEEDAVEKAKLEERIASAMNGSRAQYGLKPISWEL